LGAGLRAEYVPTLSVPFAVPLECFNTVDRQIELESGSRALGWRIVECPNIYIEGEFHAVWRSPAGSLYDLLPEEGEARTLFAPDPSRTWTGERVANVRLALLDHPAVRRFIECGERWDRALRGRAGEEVTLDRSDLHGLQLTPEERRQFMALVIAHRGRNDPCYCGSGRKMKKCHGLTAED
jgi:hypothetical protein